MIELPEHLRDAVLQGTCVAFAGAGVSIPSGMPGWKELVTTLVEELKRIDPAKAHELVGPVDGTKLTQAAQFVKMELGERVYVDVLVRLYRQNAKPNQNHTLISGIPFRGIITTNFDKMIETAYTLSKGVMPVLFTSLSTSSLASALFSRRYFIFKFHGDIDHPESIILTKQDYDRVIFSSPHVKTFLHTVFSQNTVLFLGYSLSDPDFELLISELSVVFEGATPPHYALLPNPDAIKVDDLKRRLNIRVVSYEPDGNHEEVTGALKNLHDYCMPPAEADK